MTQRSCMIFGTAHQLLPTFQSTGVEEAEYQDRKYTMDAYRGDIANRGKGRLLVRRKV